MEEIDTSVDRPQLETIQD